MKTPFDLVETRNPTPEQKHLERAASYIRRLFHGHKQEPIEPGSQQLITVKGYKVWRLAWRITEKFLFNSNAFLTDVKPNRNDVLNDRTFVVDIYQDNILDYIITPGHVDSQARKGSQPQAQAPSARSARTHGRPL